jgi:hypothetical protein
MNKIITSFILTYSLSSFAGIIPLAARFSGAGSVYGIGYETQLGDYKVVAGGISGDASAFGGLITRKFSKNFELSAALGQFTGASLLTTYQRNLNDDTDEQYILNMKGNFVSVGSKLWLLLDYLTLSASATKSTVQFDSFSDSGGDEIDLAGANLFDVETLETKVGIKLNMFDDPRAPGQGIGVSTSIANISGRKGQSDQMILDYSAIGILPLHSFFSLLGRVQYSDAIINVNSNYDSEQEIKDALNANCSGIADSVERAKCLKIEAALVSYILQNNLRGTARPIGGSSGLRSFRELRFKSSHTAIYSTEFITNLSGLIGSSSKSDSYVDLAIFYDIGYANDDKLKLFDESKFSNGVELRLIKNNNSVKLQAAAGSDNTSSWSLSFGNAF